MSTKEYGILFGLVVVGVVVGLAAATRVGVIK